MTENEMYVEEADDRNAKRMIKNKIARMDDNGFQNLTESLFGDKDTVGLILMLDRITNDAMSSWRQTEEGTTDEIIEVRDNHLLPAIRRLGHICLSC